MRMLILAASLVLAVAFPAVAQAKAPTREHVREYVRAYDAARSEFGARAVGCEFRLERAAARRRCHGRISDSAVIKSLGVLERLLAPPPRPVTVVPASTSAALVSNTITPAPLPPVVGTGGSCGGITPYAGGGQCWAIPYSIVSCESGGQNVPNSQRSGANGYYQLMNGGTGSRSQQDQAAARLWNGGVDTSSGLGPQNWVCK